jgi:hypothetical protein
MFEIEHVVYFETSRLAGIPELFLRPAPPRFSNAKLMNLGSLSTGIRAGLIAWSLTQQLWAEP